MITEDYVSFETAKLLKEKGFDTPVKYFFNQNGLYCAGASSYNWNDDKDIDDGCEDFSRPTLQMAMKWLREVHHYYIQVMLDSWVREGRLGYYVVLQRTDNDYEMMLQDAFDEGFYETYEEACEAAIKYCLENLV